MKRFLVTYLAPGSVIDDWKKTDPEKRKMAEEKMRDDWGNWMRKHANIFVDKGAGVGKTRRVTAQGSGGARNDIMLYAVVQADSHEAASKLFEDHPHLSIPSASIEVMEINPLRHQICGDRISRHFYHPSELGRFQVATTRVDRQQS